MDNRKIRMTFLTGIMACFSFFGSYAQPAVKTSVDKNEILIGGQLKLTIEADFLPEEYKINWPVIPDSLAHFEVLVRSKKDSLYSNNQLTGIVQTLTLTSFDSGKWILPSFLVSAVPVKAGGTTHDFFTDSVPVTVSFSTADSTGQLRDIKPVREVETVSHFWYWIGAGVLLVALAILLLWLYRNRKKKKVPVPFKSKLSAYDEAMTELENLKTLNLSVPAEIKLVHTKLAEILKRYLSRIHNGNYLTKTTSDVLILLRDKYLDKNIVAKAAAGLRCSDAVKFAKYLPPVSESEESLQSMKELLTIINKQTQTPQTVPTPNRKP